MSIDKQFLAQRRDARGPRDEAFRRGETLGSKTNTPRAQSDMALGSHPPEEAYRMGGVRESAAADA